MNSLPSFVNSKTPTTPLEWMATHTQPLQLDIAANSGLFSLSVELQPLRKADEVAALQLALRRYPAGTPKRLEKIAGDIGREYTVEQVTGLIEEVDLNSPAFLQLSSSLPQDGDTIYLIPPVDRCRAALLAWMRRSSWSGGGTSHRS